MSTPNNSEAPILQQGSESGQAPVPFKHRADLETPNFYTGNLMSFLVTGSESNGRVAMMEYQAKPGNEPPPHIPAWEHEPITSWKACWRPTAMGRL